MSGPIGAFRIGIAALNHKVGDHAMESSSVIKLLFCQFDEIVDMLGSHFGKKTQFDLAELCRDDCLGLDHISLLPRMIGNYDTLKKIRVATHSESPGMAIKA